MSLNTILILLCGVCLVLYLIRRRARVKNEE